MGVCDSTVMKQDNVCNSSFVPFCVLVPSCDHLRITAIKDLLCVMVFCRMAISRPKMI